MDMISGEWRVFPESGRVPAGLRVSVKGQKGWTKLGPLPIGRLRVTGSSFSHRLLPLRNELVGREGSTWYGQMRLLGKVIGTFRMERARPYMDSIFT